MNHSSAEWSKILSSVSAKSIKTVYMRNFQYFLHYFEIPFICFACSPTKKVKLTHAGRCIWYDHAVFHLQKPKTSHAQCHRDRVEIWSKVQWNLLLVPSCTLRNLCVVSRYKFESIPCSISTEIFGPNF